jgi:hypothetical protein
VSFGDDLFLRGTCSLFPTPGSHGNLGELLASHGPRQLRVDAKMALSVLPPLAGKGFKEALEILKAAAADAGAGSVAGGWEAAAEALRASAW